MSVTVLGLLLIVYYAWFPFDFVDDDKSLAEVFGGFTWFGFTWSTSPPWHLREVPSNLMVFVPLGLGIAGIARSRGASSRVALFAATTAAVLWSTFVEVVQSAWLLREPAVDDIVANTIGALAGGVLLTRFEPHVGNGLRRAGRALDQRRWQFWCLALSAIPTVLITTAVVGSRDSPELASWDTTYPLVLGNEATGDRPWSGQIARVSLIDRALSGPQVSALLDGLSPGDVAPESELIDYDFTVAQALPDGLAVQGSRVDQDAMLADGGLRADNQQWAASTEPPASMVTGISAVGEFTVYVDVTTSSLSQGGPARILTISPNPWRRDLTVAQDGADLIIRVRSGLAGMNGASPEFALPDAFDGGSRHVFVIVYDSSSISVTVDDTRDTSTIDLLPATAPMLERFVDDVGRLRFSPLGDIWRNGFLAASMFGLWAVSNAAMARTQRHWWGLARVAVVLLGVGLIFWRTLPGRAVGVGEVVIAVATTATVYVAAARVVGHRESA